LCRSYTNCSLNRDYTWIALMYYCLLNWWICYGLYHLRLLHCLYHLRLDVLNYLRLHYWLHLLLDHLWLHLHSHRISHSGHRASHHLLVAHIHLSHTVSHLVHLHILLTHTICHHLILPRGISINSHVGHLLVHAHLIWRISILHSCAIVCASGIVASVRRVTRRRVS